MIRTAGVFVWESWGAVDIIHAAGVQFGFPSSAPRLARGWRLPGWRDALEFVTEILEVVRADA